MICAPWSVLRADPDPSAGARAGGSAETAAHDGEHERVLEQRLARVHRTARGVRERRDGPRRSAVRRSVHGHRQTRLDRDG
jgi:hypothetical protein